MRINIIIPLTVFFIVIPILVRSEEDSLYNEVFISLLEEISEKEDADVTDELYEKFSELTENPVNLNETSREELESIPLLSKDLAESISYYIYRHGPLKDINELKLVDGIDEKTLKLLKSTTFAGFSKTEIAGRRTLKEMLKYGKSEIRMSSGRTVQKKTGYINDESESGGYTGDPLSFSLRYGFKYKETMMWGMVVEKDPGEKLFSKKILADYNSFNFSLNEIGIIKNLIVGDYSLSFGQGLVCGNNFSLGKNLSSSAPDVYGNKIKRHFSLSEQGFMRGLASSIYLNRGETGSKKPCEIILTGFWSGKKIDSNMEGEYCTTISKTGLHRTSGEIENRSNNMVSTYGLHLASDFKNVQLGFTAFNWRLKHELKPEIKPYNLFYFRGNQGSDYSVDYRFKIMNILIYGEFGVDKEGDAAAIGCVSIRPSSRLNVSGLYRNYSVKYDSFFGNAFCEGSGVRNERGFYSTLEWFPLKFFRLNAYVDIFEFPWLTYTVNSPSSGHEYAAQIIWNNRRDSEISLRIKFKNTDSNISGETGHLVTIAESKKEQYRLKYRYNKRSWIFCTTFDLNQYRTGVQKGTSGIALSQTISYKPANKKVSMDFRYAVFDAANYENRIFLYENSLPGNFSMPSLYGTGSRQSVCLNFDLSRNLKIYTKLGNFIYSDKDYCGTGNERVDGRCLTDIELMVKWKF